MLDDVHRVDLLEVLNDRHNARSIIVASGSSRLKNAFPLATRMCLEQTLPAKVMQSISQAPLV